MSKIPMVKLLFWFGVATVIGWAAFSAYASIAML